MSAPSVIAEPVPAPIALAASRWRREPFRLFFPLGVLLAWVGVGHWVLYASGVTLTYPGRFHGLVQMQGFAMAFAVGFLLTALPRRTQTQPATYLELAALAVGLVVVTIAGMTERWVIAEAAYAGLLLLLIQFAVRRFLGRAAGRRPPAAFVLLPIAFLQGLVGAFLIATADIESMPLGSGLLGRLLVHQGVFLCLAMGVGSLVLPLMAGAPPPPDLGSTPRETWKAVAYAFAGLLIIVSLGLEHIGFLHSGPLLRGVVVAIGLGVGGGAWRRPARPGLHRQLVWVSAWLMPIGLIAAGLWPDYRLPALHILFIGGFSLMVFGVATHVVVSHLDMNDLAEGRPPVVIALAVLFTLALLARVVADFSATYMIHLGWAAGVWLLGSLLWLLFFGPKLLRR